MLDKLLALMDRAPDEWYTAAVAELRHAELKSAEKPLDEQRAERAEDSAANSAEDGGFNAYADFLFMLLIRMHQYRLMFRLMACALIGLALAVILK